MRRASHFASRERLKRSSLACAPEGGLYAFIPDYYPVSRRYDAQVFKAWGEKGQPRAIEKPVRQIELQEEEYNEYMSWALGVRVFSSSLVRVSPSLACPS